MRKGLIFIGLLLAGSAFAQVENSDYLVLGDRDLTGTSRYVAMGGAMAALGGDPSAASDNPAGLGVYRRNELSLTFDHQIRNYQGLLSQQFSVGQASWNFSFVNDRMSGVVANSVMLSYRRLKNYRRQFDVSVRNMSASQTDVMAYNTYGLPETSLQGDAAWDNTDIGWLSKIGYETYLIDPDTTSTENEWLSACKGQVNGRLNVVESGSADEFSIGWGMNISNQWYIGAEMGLRSLIYRKTSIYREVFEDGSNYQSSAYFSASGVGFQGKVGLLYRPTASLRLAAAFHSPTVMALTIHDSGTLDAVTASAATKVSTGDYPQSYNYFSQPLRVVVGVAGQFSTKGIISLQYDYQHDLRKGVPNTHWLKLGGEIVVNNNWFFNLGYALQMRDLKAGKWADPIYRINYRSTRLDTDFANLQAAHHLSAGASFRNRFIVVGVAYQCRLMSEYIHFHELHEQPLSLASTTHRVLLTISWRH